MQRSKQPSTSSKKTVDSCATHTHTHTHDGESKNCKLPVLNKTIIGKFLLKSPGNIQILGMPNMESNTAETS